MIMQPREVSSEGIQKNEGRPRNILEAGNVKISDSSACIYLSKTRIKSQTNRLSYGVFSGEEAVEKF